MDQIRLNRLTIIAGEIDNLTKQAMNVSDNINPETLEGSCVVLAKLKAVLNRFNSELLNYFNMCSEPDADEISTLTTTQLHGEEALAELETKIDLQNKSCNNTNTYTVSTITSGKLPKLALPTFTGNILEWHQFWDQFSSNIDSRNLTNVDKLLYLKASLKGEAETIIDGLDTTNNNYQIAITTLRERYGRENQVIDAHYAALYQTKAALKITECRETLDIIERHLRVLTSLGEDVNQNHLRFLIMGKFPENVLYELKIRTQNESIEEIRKGLQSIITAKEEAYKVTEENKPKTPVNYTTEALYVNSKEYDNQRGIVKQARPFDNWKNKRNNDGWRNTNAGEPEAKKRKSSCIFCQGNHYNDQCENVKTIEERKNKLRYKCYSCFRPNHQAKKCRWKIPCVHCNNNESHNRALCPQLLKNPTNTLFTNQCDGAHTVLLQTAIVMVEEETNSVKCRALLDTGSQRSYVTKQIAKALNLPTIEENQLSVFTFGSKSPKEINSPLVKLNMMSRTNESMTVYANVVSMISHGVPYTPLDWNHYNMTGVLADDGSLSDRVDILIGNDYYHSLMLTKKKKLSDDLFLVDSKLGWIPSGKVENRSTESLSVITYFQSSTQTKLNDPDPPLDNGNLKLLWDLESIGITDSPTACRDEEAINQFNKHTRLINNRYTVRWPWNEYPPNLPSNFGLAFGRLVNLLKRMDSNTLSLYNETLKDQLKKGIIEEIPPEDILKHPVHYIPHHGVAVPGKPLRIVYDASARTKGNKSLNQCLYCGPMMLEDLTGLLLKFRCYPIGISADVEKAFLQIALVEDDRDVTRFLWLKDITKPASEGNLTRFRFTRVPFGVVSSPFLLNATIKHHLQRSNLEIVKELASDIYVDNLITGTNSVQEALELYTTAKETFQQISMNLREWNSNSKAFMQLIPDTSTGNVVKILGLDWQLRTDTLNLRFKNGKQPKTKRGILKVVASIYDPCGYAVPPVLPAKLLIQDLWKSKVDWDEILSKEIINQWDEIQNNLNDIKEISIPRYYLQATHKTKCQLHCFTDASTKAYAAVVYLVQGSRTTFVIGKSRLTPIKDQDSLKIPRLELMGVLIGTRLIKYCLKFLQLDVTQQILWTDSQIVISWCNSDKLLVPFVDRRITEIKTNKNLVIRYVPSELNSADIATRPSYSKEDLKKWLSGPEFINKDTSEWPPPLPSMTIALLAGEDLPRNTKLDNTQQQENNNQTVEENTETEEQGKSRQNLSGIQQEIKDIQIKYFSEEVKGTETCLSRNLGLFKDIDGILRCKGRLKNAEWSFDKRYPVLIPKDCEFTENIIRSTHEKYYHVGANHTLSIIRQSYWIPQGKSKVQKIIRKCSRCIKHGGGPFKLPPTPALPPERVNFSMPFTFTGMDYLGPITVQTEKGSSKRWICLLTCLAVRAIHLEVVHDLTAEEGLLALRRMIASRGIPTQITSDNALYFKLMSEILSKSYCIENKIRWKFIPQLAPWFGGFYERLVGMVKHCMKRTLQKHLLNDTQLMTIVKEIEAVLNTRPLTCIDSEMDHILKPSDFLTAGQCITMDTTQEETAIEGTTTKVDLIKSWKRARVILEEFKEMFTNRYLPSLRERYWNSHKEPRVTSKVIPTVGQTVQIMENKNREGWKVGKIVSLIIGSDGHCRIAKVKVGNVIFTRSIAHLYPLEIEERKNRMIDPNQESTSTRRDEDEEESPNMMSEILGANSSGTVHTDIEIPVMTSDDNTADINNSIDVNKSMENKEMEIMINNTDKINNHNNRLDDEVNYNVNTTEILPDIINNDEANELPPEDLQPRRAAFSRALNKIREWTHNLAIILL